MSAQPSNVAAQDATEDVAVPCVKCGYSWEFTVTSRPRWYGANTNVKTRKRNCRCRLTSAERTEMSITAANHQRKRLGLPLYTA